MDNHFVPNLTIGLPVVERLAEVSTLPLDCHLMITDVDTWGPGYAEAGARSVTFHVEASSAPAALARDLRRLGARAGMALKPGTPIDDHADLLPRSEERRVGKEGRARGRRSAGTKRETRRPA